MINLSSITNENNKEHNEKCQFILDHLHIILIISGSGTGKTNALLNLIKEQDDVDKIYLHSKDLSEPKYEFLIKKCEDVAINHFNDHSAFIECSNRRDDVDQNIDDCNASKKRKVLIAFDDMITDIMSNKKIEAIIKELFIRCRKLNISLVFITQSYFSPLKDVRLNSTYYENHTEKNYKELQLIILQILIITIL